MDFYLLADDSLNSVRLFCCRLAEKAWKLGHRVWIRTENAEATRQLDVLLWNFHDDSFLPHAKLGDNEASHSPIVIGESRPDENIDLLINLGVDVPAQANTFPRIAEIINEDTQLKKQGRLRYSYYDKSNYTLKHHSLN